MKQKIEMMTNFKSIGSETTEKIAKAEEQKQKIASRLEILESKEEQHKMLLAKAHLVMEEYKRAIIKINEVLPKKEKEAHNAKEKVKKNEKALADMDKKFEELDKNYGVQVNQLQGLKTLEENLKKELSL